MIVCYCITTSRRKHGKVDQESAPVNVYSEVSLEGDFIKYICDSYMDIEMLFL